MCNPFMSGWEWNKMAQVEVRESCFIKSNHWSETLLKTKTEITTKLERKKTKHGHRMNRNMKQNFF